MTGRKSLVDVLTIYALEWLSSPDCEKNSEKRQCLAKLLPRFQGDTTGTTGTAGTAPARSASGIVRARREGASCRPGRRSRLAESPAGRGALCRVHASGAGCFFQARMAKCSIWYYTKWYSAVPREVPSPFRHVVMPTCLLFEERLPHGEQSCSIKRARSLR